MKRISLIIACVAFAFFAYMMWRPGPDKGIHTNDQQGGIAPRPASSGEQALARVAIPENVTPVSQVSNGKSNLAVSDISPERRRLTERQVDQAYGRILNSANASQGDKIKARELLIEWFLSGISAQQIAEEAGMQQGGQISALIDKIHAGVDAEMRAQLAPELYDHVKKIIAAGDYLVANEVMHAPQYNDAGDPLTPSQSLGLSLVMAGLYSETADAVITSKRTSDVDSKTGLSALDRIAIKQASEVLNPDQIPVLSSILAGNTARALAAEETRKVIQKQNHE